MAKLEKPATSILLSNAEREIAKLNKKVNETNNKIAQSESLLDSCAQNLSEIAQEANDNQDKVACLVSDLEKAKSLALISQGTVAEKSSMERVEVLSERLRAAQEASLKSDEKLKQTQVSTEVQRASLQATMAKDNVELSEFQSQLRSMQRAHADLFQQLGMEKRDEIIAEIAESQRNLQSLNAAVAAALRDLEEKRRSIRGALAAWPEIAAETNEEHGIKPAETKNNNTIALDLLSALLEHIHSCGSEISLDVIELCSINPGKLKMIAWPDVEWNQLAHGRPVRLDASSEYQQQRALIERLLATKKGIRPSEW